MNRGIQIELPDVAGGELLGRVVELRRTTTTTVEERVVVREDDEDEAENQDAWPAAAPRIAGPLAVRQSNEITVPRKASGEEKR